MAYIKSFQSEQLATEFPNAYHAIKIDDSLAHYGVLRLFVEVFASKQAAQPPEKVRQMAMNSDGSHKYVVNDDGNPIDYVWEDVPDHRQRKGSPVGHYQIEVWNRQPAERKLGDGGTDFIVDAAAFDALLVKGAPIAEKYNPKAQAYRLVRGMQKFADATDDK